MSSAFDLSALEARAAAAIEIARHVGREAARFRAEKGSGLKVENKGLQDFVTVADRNAERAICDGLLGLFPQDTFVGEETGGGAGSTGTWVVDPIDGTTNYIRGLPHWGVSIAFCAEGRLEIGVVYDAAKDSVVSAIRGRGAFREGTPIRAAATSDPANAICILGHSRKTSFDEHLSVSRRLHERGMDYRRMGAAAIDLLRVAEGAADLYYERHLNAWDMLAGALIAFEAGAKVAMPALSALLFEGGPVVAYSPGLAREFEFIMEIEDLAPVTD
ncbi:inositol monophosphatase [Rhizobium sp. SEMIA 4085]|uniref:Inositol-1-monophosphatase n=1 Tax=Rhizobium gallicum bv. gallicum R602sp TaxID=1041138 RepID=A0A0B4XB98_9HYPH|nr:MULTISPECIES: inositol monophosphatase family protein [Rhizobium]AJD45289.1 inositol 1-phosphatase protein [Rhizobium gallicum bv. gallicum R602sp]NNH30807.1 inositol monophosphatase [Rhizobium sp. SEMIA 4085]TDW27374.1 myo-inositol-1(or 4)-monophosphatase [Rhizobium azibense]